MIADWKEAGWPVVRIRDIGRLHGGGTPSRKLPEFFQGTIPWITGQDIPEGHVAEVSTARDYVTEEAVQGSATRVVPKGAVLVTTRVSVGKAAVAGCRMCFSQDVTAILLHSETIALPSYVAHFLRSRRGALLQKNQGSTIAGITRDSLALEHIPLPSVSEQRRIVEILHEAEEICRLRAEAETATAALSSAIFDGIFGSPSAWKGGPKLGDLVRIVGGGTPSKSVEHFYTGAIPWATSKDIKKRYLDDTEDHVTEEAVQASATNIVPPKTVLVVVKSKILAHSLPMAIIDVPMCFGQDLKGLIPNPGVTPEFIVHALQAQARRILSRARGANTEGLTLEALRSLTVPDPATPSMQRFAGACEEISALGTAALAGNRLQSLTSASLLAHIFSGQITTAWREAHRDQLTLEAGERDACLREAGAALPRLQSETTEDWARFLQLPTEGIYAELNREQRQLLRAIERMVGGVLHARYFSARQLGDYLAHGPLRRNPHVIEGHLAVLAARGLIIPVSREEQTEDMGEFVFGNAYRLPLVHYEPANGVKGEVVAGDASRLRELERLAAQIEKERMLP